MSLQRYLTRLIWLCLAPLLVLLSLTINAALVHLARQLETRGDRPWREEWVRRHPNLLVSRSFSKAYGLAGLRVGYMATDVFGFVPGGWAP